MDLSLCGDCGPGPVDIIFNLVPPILFVISLGLFVKTILIVSKAFLEVLMSEPNAVFEGCEYSLTELHRAGLGTLFHKFPGLVFVSNDGAMIEIQRFWRIRMTIRLAGDRQDWRIRRSLRAGDVLESMFLNEIKLAQDRARLTQNVLALQPSVSEARCAYCREQIGNDTPILCDRCSTPHHVECFELNNGCSVFGCLSVAAVRSDLTLLRPA